MLHAKTLKSWERGPGDKARYSLPILGKQSKFSTHAPPPDSSTAYTFQNVMKQVEEITGTIITVNSTKAGISIFCQIHHSHLLSSSQDLERPDPPFLRIPGEQACLVFQNPN